VTDEVEIKFNLTADGLNLPFVIMYIASLKLICLDIRRLEKEVKRN